MNVKELVEKYRKQLAEVGGMDNGLVSVPAFGVRKMLEEFEAAADAMQALLGTDFVFSGQGFVPPISPKEFAERMWVIAQYAGSDRETAHQNGDGEMLTLLRSLGYGEGCDAFNAIEPWYA